MPYIHRTIEPVLKKYLRLFPVVGITGPRQSGKSTMIRHLLSKSYRYVNFDDFDMVQSFYADPKKFMKLYGDRVIFDEAQRVPELYVAIKFAVDNDRQKYGKFVLTGSSQFPFLNKITESLAGRIGLLSLLPLQFTEIPKNLRFESIYRGGYPEQVIRGYNNSRAWNSSYIETYLSRDVRDLSNIGNLREFRRCLQLLAARTSQVLIMSGIATDIGVSVNTVKKWISILEASYILFLLPPFYKNLGKRIVKSPKVYFYDTGLVSFLTGISTKELFESGPMYGALFENYVVSEIMKREMHKKTDADLYYYRTSNGVEVDLIIDRKTSTEYVEIKSSESYRAEYLQSIRKLKGDKDQAYLIYQGKDIPFDEKISILNYEGYLKS